VFSFYPTKTLQCLEGGMIVTDDDELYRYCQQARLHGIDASAYGRSQRAGAWGYDIQHIGMKCNPTDINAAVGLAQLARYEQTLGALRAISARYVTALEDHPHIAVRPRQTQGNQHLFVVAADDGDSLLTHLQSCGVQGSRHYPPLWAMTGTEGRFVLAVPDVPLEQSIPRARSLTQSFVSLPIYEALSAQDQSVVISALLSYAGGTAKDGA